MKKETKPGRLRGLWLWLKEKIISLWNTMASCMSIASRAGKKGGASERLLSISSISRGAINRSPTLPVLYDSAYHTPLSVYINMMVDDDLSCLVISGTPTREELEEAKLKIVAEYTEISGGGETKAFTEIASTYYSRYCGVIGLEMAMKLLLAKRFDVAIEFLNKSGVRCTTPETDDEYDRLLFTVEMKYKNRLAKFNEASGHFKALSSRGEKPTRKYYNRLLIMLSTCEVIKMQLNPKEMTVAEFAEYLNVFNEYQNALKIKKYRK